MSFSSHLTPASQASINQPDCLPSGKNCIQLPMIPLFAAFKTIILEEFTNFPIGEIQPFIREY